eukprot:jgi/Tetstr1/422681/TSEL_013479.t1
MTVRDPLAAMADLKAATKQCDQFKKAFSKGDLSGCTRMLSTLKLALTTLPALPPNNEQTPTAQQELMLARDVLEHAVFLSVKLKDETLFERNYAQLKTYYTDTRDHMPHSDNEFLIVALNLMRLLVQNRIAEFHTELELLPAEAQANAYIKHATQLEQYLMEGAYRKVLASQNTVPAESFKYFMDCLTSTVREEIASCSEKAYQSLRVKDAKDIMLFKNEKEVLSYASERGWEVQDGKVLFTPAPKCSAAKELPSLELINYTLTYAKELERIV